RSDGCPLLRTRRSPHEPESRRETRRLLRGGSARSPHSRALGSTLGLAASAVKPPCTGTARAAVDDAILGWHCPASEYGTSPSETARRRWGRKRRMNSRLARGTLITWAMEGKETRA